MTPQRLMRISERWFRLLMRLYPVDFREEHGPAVVETYRDRARAASERGGARAMALVWLSALMDSLRNGPGERVQPAVTWRRTGDWGRDMELAVRRLIRAPMFVTSMVGTLAIGLGAFAVVATVVYKVLLAPLPYDNPDDLYFVWRDYTAFFDLDRGWLGGTDVAALQEAGGVIEDAAALLRTTTTLTSGAGVDPLQIPVMVTSPNLFALLGVEPAIGRVFTAQEAGPGRPPLIVLTHDLWQRLGGERTIVGTELRLNGDPFTVIGVMPESFQFVRNASLGTPQSADAYIALEQNLAETNPGAGSYAGLVRARPGTTLEELTRAVTSVARMVDERDFESRGLKLYPVGAHEDLVAGVRPALRVVGLAGVFLVLVLMVNLATLLLARATQREKEFAVARALGASPIAVMRATIVEGALLGGLGGAFGAAAAVWGTSALIALAPADLPRREFIALDWPMAAAIVLLGAFLGLLAATLPAIWGARTNLATLLGNSAVRGGGSHGRMRRSMVVAQVALSLMLLSTGGLVVRSFDRLLRADAGFDPQNVLTVRVPITEQHYADSTAALPLQDRIHEALVSLPGVTAVSGANALPLSANASQTTIGIPGAPGNTGDEEVDRPLVDWMATRAGYFDVIGARIIAGRGFEEYRNPEVREAIIDNVLAEQFFPTGTAIGAAIPFGDDTLTVVGVVAQPHMYDMQEAGRPQLYIRAEDWGILSLSWVIRSTRPPTALIPEVRSAVHGVHSQLALADMKPMTDIVNASVSQQRVSAVLIGGFALGALLLAAMGLFGVVSAAVTRRRHELAVRLALGADHGRVLRLVLGEGAKLVLAGVAIGGPGTYFAGRAISSALVGVSPADPLTLVSVAMMLAAVALGACYVPARRVLRIQPARSLRNDTA